MGELKVLCTWVSIPVPLCTARGARTAGPGATTPGHYRNHKPRDEDVRGAKRRHASRAAPTSEELRDSNTRAAPGALKSSSVEVVCLTSPRLSRVGSPQQTGEHRETWRCSCALAMALATRGVAQRRGTGVSADGRVGVACRVPTLILAMLASDRERRRPATRTARRVARRKRRRGAGRE